MRDPANHLLARALGPCGADRLGPAAGLLAAFLVAVSPWHLHASGMAVASGDGGHQPGCTDRRLNRSFH